jgi:oligosaccharide translocation protein RFT1
VNQCIISMYHFSVLVQSDFPRAMSEMRTGVRVRAEGFGITFKTSVTFFIMLWESMLGARQGEYALVAFAGGQLAYVLMVLAVYRFSFGQFSPWPKIIQPMTGRTTTKLSMYFDPIMLRLSFAMTSQSILKHFLTEGDKMMLSTFSPLHDQGGFAIAANYGSLIARVLFQPIEEIMRVYFSKMLAPSQIGSRERSQVHQAGTMLISLLTTQISMAVVILVFGTVYLPIVLHAVLPPQYLLTSAPQVLSAWVWYVPVLAVNGGLEAFVSSVATPIDLHRQSRWMVMFSVIYITAAISLYALQVGDASLVYANIINLSARIWWSFCFISAYFQAHQAQTLISFRKVLPGPSLLSAAAISMVITWYSEKRNEVMVKLESDGRVALLSLSLLVHIALGAILASTCLLIWWISYGHKLIFLKRVE